MDETYSEISPEIKDNFFSAVRMGSILELEIMLEANGTKLMKNLAGSYNEQGETPLLIAIKHKYYDIFDFLIDYLHVDVTQNSRFLWNGVECGNVPPLFAAIVSDADTNLIERLMDLENVGEPAIAIKSIISSSNTRQQKIDALELMGAAYVIFSEQIGRKFGIPCWMEAMALRNSTLDGESQLPKILYPSDLYIRNAIGNVTEVATLSQLQLLASEEPYSKHVIQAFLTSYRILNQMTPTSNMFPLHILYNQAVKCSENDQYSQAIKISMCILNVWKFIDKRDLSKHLTFFDQTSPTELLISKTLDVLTRSFRDMLYQRSAPIANIGEEETLFDKNISTFYLACTLARILEFKKESVTTSALRNLIIYQQLTLDYVLDLISFLIIEMEPQLGKKDKHDFEASLKNFIHLHYSTSHRNLLHVVCSRRNVQTSAIQLLLRAGIDPYAPDLEGNTPLHLLVTAKYSILRDERHSVGAYCTERPINTQAIKVLINAGCHLDWVNNEGLTVLDLIKVRRDLPAFMGESPNPELLPLINTVLPLACCCARVIRTFRLTQRNLPTILQYFVCRH